MPITPTTSTPLWLSSFSPLEVERERHVWIKQLRKTTGGDQSHQWKLVVAFSCQSSSDDHVHGTPLSYGLGTVIGPLVIGLGDPQLGQWVFRAKTRFLLLMQEVFGHNQSPAFVAFLREDNTKHTERSQRRTTSTLGWCECAFRQAHRQRGYMNHMAGTQKIQLDGAGKCEVPSSLKLLEKSW